MELVVTAKIRLLPTEAQHQQMGRSGSLLAAASCLSSRRLFCICM
ncbi:hypothetical protein BRO54_3580 [Geobacillus proteiniphilus]|uniref:Uncharacterized protein n=1 Tax=Geobacillus proteiniphilus TaxID=860353 RepID=A0A1Q5SL17_9BACL|nr:hypothetical protein [Geobacillus proteiniphilus]OKO88714.1 hypothetical protein BRO54_3580 [Geobacillus proteiniphilus]